MRRERKELSAVFLKGLEISEFASFNKLHSDLTGSGAPDIVAMAVFPDPPVERGRAAWGVGAQVEATVAEMGGKGKAVASDVEMTPLSNVAGDRGASPVSVTTVAAAQ